MSIKSDIPFISQRHETLYVDARKQKIVFCEKCINIIDIFVYFACGNYF